MATEIELKYRAASPEPLRWLASTATLGEAALGPVTTVDEVDRYVDTAGERLAAAGWACRLRTRLGVTRLSMKGPAEPSTDAALHRRPESEGPASESLDPDDWPASDAHELLDRLRDGRPLNERFRLLQRRTERSVVLAAEPLGTLSLDEVKVEARGIPRGGLLCVELELRATDGTAGDGTSLAMLAEALAAVEGLTPDPRTKLEHALALLDPP